MIKIGIEVNCDMKIIFKVYFLKIDIKFIYYS